MIENPCEIVWLRFITKYSRRQTCQPSTILVKSARFPFGYSTTLHFFVAVAAVLLQASLPRGPKSMHADWGNLGGQCLSVCVTFFFNSLPNFNLPTFFWSKTLSLSSLCSAYKESQAWQCSDFGKKQIYRDPLKGSSQVL